MKRSKSKVPFLVLSSLVVVACSKRPTPAAGEAAAAPSAARAPAAAPAADAAPTPAGDAAADPTASATCDLDTSVAQPACEAFAGDDCLLARCERLAMVLRPRLAVAALACLAGAPACEGGSASSCIAAATTGKGCEDTVTAEQCAAMRQACGAPLDGCEGQLGAFGPAGRHEVLRCMMTVQGRACGDADLTACTRL